MLFLIAESRHREACVEGPLVTEAKLARQQGTGGNWCLHLQKEVNCFGDWLCLD